MWAYRIIQKETRRFVPTFKTFFLQNNDITKIFFEKHFLLEGEVYSFPISLGKFIFYLSLMLLFSISFLKTTDYQSYDECYQRNVCLQSCITNDFPKHHCEKIENYTFYYGGNTFTQLYKYEGIGDSFEFCKSFIKNNSKYEVIGGIQKKVNVCFPFCKDEDSLAINDTRAQCIEESLLCVMPQEECYLKIIKDEIILKKGDTLKSTLSFSPIYSILAIVATTPIQFLFDLFCVYVSKIKGKFLRQLHKSLGEKIWQKSSY